MGMKTQILKTKQRELSFTFSGLLNSQEIYILLEVLS